MPQNPSLHSLMMAFAEDTGLTGSAPPRRYLWTDAFAVCNYLELHRQTGGQEYRQLALDLVEQVHAVLGRDRDSGAWLSGLDDKEALLHPTQGGLRIGKQLAERRADEPYDELLEWDRDGQYFHYLTRWMHALNCVSRATGDGRYNQWAIELARVAHAAFSYLPATGTVKRMVWKMSTDLTRPLVDSIGQHDPLDGLITCQQLQATARRFPDTPGNPDLETEIEELTAMCDGMDWATVDPLGIGGLLGDACRLTQLIDVYQLQENSRLESLLQDIARSLLAFASNRQHNPLNLPAEYRLAFRELGLAIGLSAIPIMQAEIKQHPEAFTHGDALNTTLESLYRFYPVRDVIRDFWQQAEHRAASTWLEHADINQVMLATCLSPDSYLTIA